jgi:hypothetical protein
MKECKIFSFSAPKALSIELVAAYDGNHYNIETWFHGDAETNTAVTTHSVKLNWYGSKRSDSLFSGTYKECYDFIVNLIEQHKLTEV